jgi:hypothetical protein
MGNQRNRRQILNRFAQLSTHRDGLTRALRNRKALPNCETTRSAQRLSFCTLGLRRGLLLRTRLAGLLQSLCGTGAHLLPGVATRSGLASAGGLGDGFIAELRGRTLARDRGSWGMDCPVITVIRAGMRNAVDVVMLHRRCLNGSTVLFIHS